MNLPKPNKINAEKYVAGMSLFNKKIAQIKLSANESALGPSPKAKKELASSTIIRPLRANDAKQGEAKMDK